MRSSTNRPDTAVILAAGRGTRLRGTLSELPKGFLPIDGEPMVRRSIRKLRDHGVTRIVIGTGHLAEAYERLAADTAGIECVRNEAYATTGSMHTLAGLRDRIEGDFLLLESDLVYEQRSLEVLLEDERADVILASGPTHSGDEVFLETDEAGRLVNVSKDARRLSRIDGELVGISKVSVETYRHLCDATADRPQLDYEHGFAAIAGQRPLAVHKVVDLAWGEIDDEAHLRRVLATVYPEILKHEGDES